MSGQKRERTCPLILRGKTLNEEGVAANAALLETHLSACGGRIDAAAAHSLLYAWLLPTMPQANRVVFGGWVRLWQRRWGVREADLFRAMVQAGCMGARANQLTLGLGSANQAIYSFWEDPRRLDVTLVVLRRKAQDALVELQVVTPAKWVTKGTPDPHGLALVDSFWDPSPTTLKPHGHVNADAMRLFGDWLRVQLSTSPRGSMKNLALALQAVKPHWAAVSAMSIVHQWLNGVSGCWDLPTLAVIAKELNLQPDQLAADYAAWCAQQATRG